MAGRDVGWAVSAILKSMQSAIDILDTPQKHQSRWNQAHKQSKQYPLAAQALRLDAELITRAYESGIKEFGPRFKVGDRKYPFL
jgi:hypothetical protein